MLRLLECPKHSIGEGGGAAGQSRPTEPHPVTAEHIDFEPAAFLDLHTWCAAKAARAHFHTITPLWATSCQRDALGSRDKLRELADPTRVLSAKAWLISTFCRLGLPDLRAFRFLGGAHTFVIAVRIFDTRTKTATGPTSG